MTTNRKPDVFFHFDPLCPWTWLTSRWLTGVAEARDLTVGWRALSLKVLNGDDAPEQYRPGLEATFAALRLVEALAAEGAYEQAGRFYTLLGESLHRAQEPASMATVEKAVAEAGAGDTGVLTDAAWDGPVVAATRQAVDCAGGDVGTPVLRWETPDRAIYGPIVTPVPGGADGLRLWDAVETVVSITSVYELKRGRPGPPEIS